MHATTAQTMATMAGILTVWTLVGRAVAHRDLRVTVDSVSQALAVIAATFWTAAAAIGLANGLYGTLTAVIGAAILGGSVPLQRRVQRRLTRP